MKTLLTLFGTLFLLLFPRIGSAQEPDYRDPDDFLVKEQRPQVLLVGTWHFSYPGLDAHKTAEENKLDILSPAKQKELMELLDYLERFQPTKIVVEGGRNTGYLMKRYQRWQSGEKPLGRNETDQIGIRLMHRMGLDTLYGCDAPSLMGMLSRQRDSLAAPDYISEITERHYWGGEDEMSLRFRDLYEYGERYTRDHSLLEGFLYYNSNKRLDRGFGAYLAGGQFDSEGFEGADALSINWFNRNLRIFKNIRDLDLQADDRILVLFGAGHTPILQYLFKCSPQFELIPFDSL